MQRCAEITLEYMSTIALDSMSPRGWFAVEVKEG
jgi:hypothetical protein